MRLLLLGANGQVGHELRRSLAPLGELVVTTRGGRLPDGTACERLDLDDPDAIAPLVERVAPDVVVNAAAYTAVDRAEDEPDTAFRLNAAAPARLAASCARRGARLVHYSTDYVFDGTATHPYREDDRPAPLGVYGASKLAGEEAIRASGVEHLVLRTAWVYGLYGHNFLRTMLRLAAERDELRVVADQVGTPTPAWLIADVTASLLAGTAPVQGTCHLVATGHTTWHAFAQAIVDRAGALGLLHARPRVQAITTAEFPTRAMRPANSMLDTTRLHGWLQAARPGWVLPDWETALQRTLAAGTATAGAG